MLPQHLPLRSSSSDSSESAGELTGGVGGWGRGGFWKSLILVHVLVRSLCSALSALCTSILPGGRTVESRFQELSNQHSLQSICFGAKVSEKMMQWRGGFRMLFVVFHRFSQGFHGSRALKNTMNSSTFHLVEANITNFFGGCLAAKHKSF